MCVTASSSDQSNEFIRVSCCETGNVEFVKRYTVTLDANVIIFCDCDLGSPFVCSLLCLRVSL